MKHIISGTNRPGSRTKQISLIIQSIYQSLGEKVEMIDLAEMPLHHMTGKEYANSLHQDLNQFVQQVNNSEGLIVVVPEYNGSMPGVLKYFIDHWKYPDTFEGRPICLVGLGGMFGGLRPVEHLQQIFGYRNSYIFPQRVFIANIWQQLKEGRIVDPVINDLLKKQAIDFTKFVKALESQKLDANAILAARPGPI
ncbi:MAG: NADPH-dependent FMN reductase [Pseudobdellovibrionaceae bacterium]